MMVKRTAIFFISLIILFASCNDDDVNTSDEVEVNYVYNNIETIQYRTDVTVPDANLLSYDVYYNDTINTLKPVVIWVHGGGWSVGDKANKFDDKIKYFESLGIVLFSINYRLTPVDANGVPNELLNKNRIKFPIHPQDVASAVSHIYSNIENYGGDKQKIVIMGHSAGAHLSTLLATDAQYLASHGLNPKDVFKGLANFDTESYNITQHLLNFGVTTTNNKATIEVDNFLDNDPSTPYHQTVITYLNAFGKNGNTWGTASPVNHINHSNKPSKYFFYYQDVATSNQNRVNIIEEFIETLDDGTNYVVSYETPFAHEIINQRVGQPNDMTDNLTHFLNECFK
ncbi:MAG: arylformamidase [Bacteroidia bacterium]|jgi:arylformamidase